jgi:hypothetical protein
MQMCLLEQFFSKSNFTDWIQALSSVAIFLIAFCQWKTYEKQAKIMEEQSGFTRTSLSLMENANNTALKSLKINEDTVKCQLRAYVDVHSISVSPSILESLDNKITVSIKNSGQTPAYNLKHIFKYKVAYLEETNFEDQLDVPFLSNVVLSAGATAQSTNTMQNNQIYRDFIKNGSHALYVYGEITYSDVFNEVHYSKYRLLQSVSSGVGAGEFVNTPEGNISN